MYELEHQQHLYCDSLRLIPEKLLQISVVFCIISLSNFNLYVHFLFFLNSILHFLTIRPQKGNFLSPIYFIYIREIFKPNGALKDVIRY